MNPLVFIGAAVTAVGAYLLYRLYQNGVVPSFAFAADDDASGGGGGVPDEQAPSGVAMQWNDAIAEAARQAGIDPILLKAIAAQESGFRTDVINPEKDFILNGVSYGQNSSVGRAALVAWMKAGNEPATIGLNPSVGIAQVRVQNAKKFLSGLDAWDLFDAPTCFLAAAYLIASDGTTLDTADMYNVGNGANWQRGVRNVAYRTKVQAFYARFAGDF